jgi:hypothetical protein
MTPVKFYSKRAAIFYRTGTDITAVSPMAKQKTLSEAV